MQKIQKFALSMHIGKKARQIDVKKLKKLAMTFVVLTYLCFQFVIDPQKWTIRRVLSKYVSTQ